MRFEPAVTSHQEAKLRLEVRDFLAERLPRGSYHPGLGMTAAHDPAFSRDLAARGWVGLTVPQKYGGAERSAMDRFVIVEELLAAGAPVAAHWIADRQTAPTILAYGTQEQKQRFLPPIARGERYFSIGMSEPDAGSDLAAVRTRATEVDGGFMVSGTKVWTSAAHKNHHVLALVRTDEGERHDGLSQLIIDLQADGVQVNPIPFLDGSHDFNEVVFDDVFVPHDRLLGTRGQGWAQVTSELAHERSGPDRYLSTFPVVETLLREGRAAESDPRTRELLGGLWARWWGLRQLSLSVARALDAGASPAIEAALVKDVATLFEQETVEVVRQMLDSEPVFEGPRPETAAAPDGSLFDRLFAAALLAAPSYTLRGGTNEVLRSVAAKGLSR